MNVIINNQPVTLPDEHLTVEQFAKLREIPRQGTAIAINDKIVLGAKWEVTYLSEGDRITVISAAFGG